jgi:GAF domain-containing protein
VSSALVHRLAEILDSTDRRELRAEHAARAIADAGGYRWVGIYDVGDEEIEIVGHTGVQAPACVHFSVENGLSGDAVRTRLTVVSNDVANDPRYIQAFESTGSEIIVPILGAETGIVIGTLDVESDRLGAFGADDQLFLETCAQALMPLFE